MFTAGALSDGCAIPRSARFTRALSDASAVVTTGFVTVSSDPGVFPVRTSTESPSRGEGALATARIASLNVCRR